VRHLRRGGRYLRVADPDWEEPLDGSCAGDRGGRWNPPGSFPVVYLCRSVAVARANVFRLLADLPYGPEDLDPEHGPVLVATEAPEERYVDAVTRRGLESLGLPPTYPRTESGRPVSRRRCQAIGLRAWEAGEPGMACRSTAATAPPRGEALAWFEPTAAGRVERRAERGGRERRRTRLTVESLTPFEDWFW
jgi:RES domain-containing protein